jgi:hypothetical protein
VPSLALLLRPVRLAICALVGVRGRQRACCPVAAAAAAAAEARVAGRALGRAALGSPASIARPGSQRPPQPRRRPRAAALRDCCRRAPTAGDLGISGRRGCGGALGGDLAGFKAVGRAARSAPSFLFADRGCCLCFNALLLLSKLPAKTKRDHICAAHHKHNDGPLMEPLTGKACSYEKLCMIS